MTTADNATTTRDAVLAAALEIVTAEGPGALTVRRLAIAAETSTMAVYTHFGSIGGVADAVVADGFDRLRRTTAGAPRTGDALSDLFAIALTYLAFACEHPELYSLMFQHSGTRSNRGRRGGITTTPGATSQGGPAAFTTFLTAFTRPDSETVGTTDVHDEQRLGYAAELWSALHGNAMLRIAGHLDPAGDSVAHSLLVTIAVGNGVDRTAADAAVDRARTALSRN
ncbi:TetR/AcrR family transcriptional regulator [Rhodococcus gannanensis]|uniref:TetR/AcrR family transcriptional regulator n=1 Tax=Rhodococcus gannanensis TaxID=1960308 RepID=A0ABW4P5N7_9NOCA